MSDTPTFKVEALREQLMQDLSQHRLVERGKTCNPADVEVFVQAFATFLEGVMRLEKEDHEDGCLMGERINMPEPYPCTCGAASYNDCVDVEREALHQVVTALRGGGNG